MHEVALATQLAKIVARAADGRRVLVVRLQVGALRQVVPQTLQFAWRFVTKDTVLGGAELQVDWIDLTIRCPAGHESSSGDPFDRICPTCGQTGSTIRGDEFRVIDIDVDSP
ncbi:hydrogenase maturation nickel metallochaperone HypA/HybF [Corynebacterium mendelii]|uniref:hydrogenase maturation nickel metallochaperone HypA/HybF n=1 Tax=Corynebacterium mendelii TaxID=2765362 RepID=UPI002ED0F465